MQPQNIELNSPINASEEGLLSKEPMFDEKNSLMYKGVVSNMTIDKGTGILSTTGKNITIDGNTLTAGNQVFSIDNSTTIETVASGILGEEDIAVGGYVCTSSKEKIEIKNGDTTVFTLHISSDSVWKSTIWNSEYFAFVTKSGRLYRFFTVNPYNGTIVKDVSHTFDDDDHFTPGNRFTSGIFNNKLYFGFDDIDYRKRFTVAVDGGTFTVYRGFGLISANGCVYGEPIAKNLSAGYAFEGLGNAKYGIPLRPSFSNIGGPDVYNNPRYKILDNGVIQFWNGWFNPDEKSRTINKNKTFLELITDENAALGATLNSATGDQGGAKPNEWRAKIHSICGQASLNTPWGQEYEEREYGNSAGVDFHNSIQEMIKWAWDRDLLKDTGSGGKWKFEFQNNFGAVTRGKRISYMITTTHPDYVTDVEVHFTDNTSVSISTTDESKCYSNRDCVDFNPDGHGYWRNWYDAAGWQGSPYYRGELTKPKINWVAGIDLSTGTVKDITLGSNYDSSCLTTNNTDSSVTACIHWSAVYGDWTYNYDSMKSYQDTTNYDGIFPCLRLFFNNANTKGKYFNYGNGWFTAYKWVLGWIQSKDGHEVSVFTQPLQLVRLNNVTSNKGNSIEDNITRLGEFRLDNPDHAKRLAEHDAADANVKGFILEPLGNLYRTKDNFGTNDHDGPSYFTCYDTLWNTEGTEVKVPATNFIKIRDFDSLKYYVRRLDITGSGKGLSEQSFNFGGIGTNTIMNSLYFTSNISKKDEVVNNDFYYWRLYPPVSAKYDGLRVQVYEGLEVGLSYKGNLIFNAGSMDFNYHFFEDDDGGLHITVYNGKKFQSVFIKSNGSVHIDKLSDYIYRLNVLGSDNLLLESHEGAFSLVRGFKSFLGEDRPNVMGLQMRIPSTNASNNNILYYAAAINTDMLKEDEQPSFLLPAKTISSYVFPNDNKNFENTVLTNRNCFIRQLIMNKDDELDIYYTSSNSTTDNTYKETDIIPEGQKETFESFVGVQSYKEDLQDTTYWIDGSVILYPIGIASEFKGINYSTSTVELPDNYSARMYSNNNKTWAVYDQNSQIYYGSNIFTVMGGNYYFDKQGIYYIGDARQQGTEQYKESLLIAYAVGMEFLCSAPSEAYFYSPFDECMYIFTAANTMQKSDNLSRFGKIIDSCYSPVNQSVYILFEGNKLFIKTQDDSALIDVEGNRLLTTANGVEVVNGDESYEIHSPYMFGESLPLDVVTEYLGNPDFLSKYSWVDIVLFKKGDGNCSVDVTVNTIAEEVVKETASKVAIKENDWKNGFYRIRVTPKDPIGNAIQIKLHSDDDISCYNITVYMESVSVKNAASAWR